MELATGISPRVTYKGSTSGQVLSNQYARMHEACPREVVSSGLAREWALACPCRGPPRPLKAMHGHRSGRN